MPRAQVKLDAESYENDYARVLGLYPDGPPDRQGAASSSGGARGNELDFEALSAEQLKGELTKRNSALKKAVKHAGGDNVGETTQAAPPPPLSIAPPQAAQEALHLRLCCKEKPH